MKQNVKLIREDGSRADRTWGVYKGQSLWFVEYNRGGEISIYKGNSEEKALDNMDNANADYVFEAEDEYEYDIVARWMELEDTKAYAKIRRLAEGDVNEELNTRILR